MYVKWVINPSFPLEDLQTGKKKISDFVTFVVSESECTSSNKVNLFCILTCCKTSLILPRQKNTNRVSCFPDIKLTPTDHHAVPVWREEPREWFILKVKAGCNSWLDLALCTPKPLRETPPPPPQFPVQKINEKKKTQIAPSSARTSLPVSMLCCWHFLVSVWSGSVAADPSETLLSSYRVFSSMYGTVLGVLFFFPPSAIHCSLSEVTLT